MLVGIAAGTAWWTWVVAERSESVAGVAVALLLAAVLTTAVAVAHQGRRLPSFAAPWRLGSALLVLLGLFLDPTVPLWLQPYLPIAVVAALDAVFGGFRARLDGIFDAKVFVISFVSNVVVAGLIVFLGDQLGVGAQLSTAVVVVLGIRIFGNAAAIRRHVFRA